MIEETFRLLPYKNDIHTAVTYEIEDTRYLIRFHWYNLFDWLSATGGIYSACYGIGFTFMTLLAINGSHNFVAA